jgi:hypothetical protein
MAIPNPSRDGSTDVVVGLDGRVVIPADDVARLHVGPGATVHVDMRVMSPPRRRLRGSMRDLPALTWEDFERGSELSQHDLNGA